MDLYLVSMSLFAAFVIDIKNSTIDCQISLFSKIFLTYHWAKGQWIMIKIVTFDLKYIKLLNLDNKVLTVKTFTYSKLTIEALEKCVKYVQIIDVALLFF